MRMQKIKFKSYFVNTGDYFVFKYPKGFIPLDTNIWYLNAPTPYDVYNSELDLDNQNPFEEYIVKYALRYEFKREQNTDKENKLNSRYFWKFTLLEMTELDVNRAFMSRALEYYGSNELTDFLEFHFNKFHSIEPKNWLEYVEKVFVDAGEIYVDGSTPTMTMVKIKKQANDWIAEKRKELANSELYKWVDDPFENECINTIQNMYGVSSDTNLGQFRFYTQNVALFKDSKFDWIRELANQGDKLNETEKHIFIALCLPTYERYLENISLGYVEDVKKKIEGVEKLYSDYLSNHDRSNPHRAYFVLCKKFQNLLPSKLGITNTPPTPQIGEVEVEKVGGQLEKLKWNCSAAIAGFIISELIAKGYIDEPKTNGNGSFSKTAKICQEIFEIDTTPKHLENVINPERNKLSDFSRKKLTLPNFKDIK
jgi:hypothetical protein